MTKNEALVLSTLLALHNQVLKGESSDAAIEKNISIINSITDTDSYYNTTICDNVNTWAFSADSKSLEVVNAIVNGIKIMANRKDALLRIIVMHNLYDTKAIQDFIDKALTEDMNDYLYYQELVRLSIKLGDSERIQSVIEKIQSMSGK